MVLEDLCILCCKFQEDSIEIFSERGVQLNIAAILSKHFWFEVKVVHHFSRVICARCWTLTKDFHQFYLTIQEAQSDFIATANYDDAEEHANGSAIANCNNGNTTTMAATLKAKFMQNDAVSLNCLNAGILEPDKSLGGLGANYELPICELPTDDDLVRNIMHDDVLHIEMQLEDNAVKSDENIVCSTATEKSNSSELQYYTNILQTRTVDTTLAIQQKSDSPVTNTSAQCISTPTQSSLSSNAPNSNSKHQIVSSDFINLPCNSQSTNLPQFKSSITNSIIVLSKSSSDTVNVCPSQTQPLPSFTVLQPQYAPVSPIDTAPHISNESLQSYQISPSKDTLTNQRQMSIGSAPLTSLALATSPQPITSTKQLMIDSQDTSLVFDSHPAMDGRPSSSLDDVPFDFPFRMDDLYRPSPSQDSGYSPSQSTTSSGLTPQYFLNGPNSIDSGILNSPTLAMIASPKESTDLPSMRLPSFSNVCSSVQSLSSLHSSESPLQHGFSETGSIYSVDSGHPSESPTQLLQFSDSASHYSSTSPNSCNPHDSPLQLHNSHDLDIDCGGPMLLAHFKDGDMSMSLDHFMDATQPLRSFRPSSMLDHFTDTSSGCFDSYENLLNDVDMPLKLPQFTDADLKQALPPTHSTDSNGPLELEDMYKVRKRRAATMDPKPISKEQPPTETPNPSPTKILEVHVVKEPNSKTTEANCAESLSVAGASCSTTDLSHQITSEQSQEVWKKSVDLSRPVQFPIALKSIISIIPLPATKPDENKPITSPFDQESNIMKELRRLATTNSMSIEAIPLTEEPTADGKRNIVMEPSRLEISVVNVENKNMPPSEFAAKAQPPTDDSDNSIDEPAPKKQRSDKIRKLRHKSSLKSVSYTSPIREEILPAIKANNINEPIAVDTKQQILSKSGSSSAIAPRPRPFKLKSKQPPSTNPIETIDLSTDQNEITHTGDSSTASRQQSLNSGKLQLLSDCLPRCSVILERIDIVNSGILLQDLNNTVQNINDNTITIPKQYTINNHVKNKRIRKGGVQLEEIDKRIQDVCELICELCQRECTNVTEMLEHYRQTHNIRGYVRCCKKKYFSRGPLMEHIRSHGSSRIKLRCELCGKSCPSQRRLKEHINEKHLSPPEKVHCDQCSKQFDGKKLLDQHIMRSHVPEAEKNFECDQCGRRFTRREFLDSHIKRVHHLIDAHACEICLKVFKSKADYKAHQLTHQNEAQQKLRCNICGACLKNENSMKKHMQRHNDIEHNCTICDRVYFNQLSLNEHMRIMHNGRDQTCTFCAKSFRTTQRLKEHMTIHTGELIYKCPYCPKAFNCNSNMYKHKKVKHPAEFHRDRGKPMLVQGRIFKSENE